MRAFRSGKSFDSTLISKFIDSVSYLSQSHNAKSPTFPILMNLQLFNSIVGLIDNGKFRKYGDYGSNDRRNNDYTNDNGNFSENNRGDNERQNPHFQGDYGSSDRNYSPQGVDDRFSISFSGEGSNANMKLDDDFCKFDGIDEGSAGFDLVGNYKGLKDSQPSADELSNKPPIDEQCIGKGGNEFLEKFKLGAVDKVGIKLDEATPMQSPEENNREAPANADEIFMRMKQSGLVPNAVAMINGLCKGGLIQEAMKLLRLMREKGAMPEVVVYTAVVEGFCQAQQFDKAKGIFRKMQNDGVVPNAYSYSVLIGGLCNGKRLDDAVEYSVEMLENGHLMNVVLFTGLVHGLCTEKGVEEARNTILMLKHKGLLLDEKEVIKYLEKNRLLSPMIGEAVFGTKKPAKNEYPF